MEDYTVKIIIKGIPSMGDKTFNSIIKWLESKKNELIKDRKEFDKTVTFCFYV